MKHWLVKQEPSAYSWDDFVRDGRTSWTGVRNYQARNNLRAMKKGDAVLFYHSVVGKCVMGEAEVVQEAYSDGTAKDGDWVCVDLQPVRALARPVTLEEIKSTASLAELPLIRHSRLSVMPVRAAEYRAILSLAKRGF